MKLSMSYREFQQYVLTQIDHFFPDGYKISNPSFKLVFDMAIERTQHCFSYVSLPTYSHNNQPVLNHLHSDQYAVFLWFLSSSVWNEFQDSCLANKLFGLNKALHGFSCMYDTALPNVFLLLHTVGTVLGKANYGDFFSVAHGCTVGAQNNMYPCIGIGVSMLTHSSIIGNCNIGDFVSIGINATTYKANIPSMHMAYNSEKGTTIKKSINPWIFNVYKKEAVFAELDKKGYLYPG